MNKNSTLIYLIVIISILGSITGFIFAEKFKNKRIINKIETVNLKEIKNEVKETTLFFVGDMMLDRGVKSSVIKNFNGDYSKLFVNLEYLKSADILFANLEGSVSDIGNNVGSKYSFHMDPQILPVIKDAGFDIVSFANNHVGDWNMSAFKDTLTNLQNTGILKIGAGLTKSEAKTPIIIEKNGIKFGFIGFSDVGPDWLEAKENSPGILLASDPNLPNIIRDAKTNCDVLIVSFHFGTEYKTIHNSRQEHLAHTAIDNGADMIIGHHPHVMEDIEMYNNRPIVYSLGNFIFDQYFSEGTMNGMLIETTFYGNQFKEIKQKIIKLNKFYQPESISEWQDQNITKKESSPCPKPIKYYEDQTYLNLDQYTKLPDTSYIPSNLEKLPEDISMTKICLKKEAKDALIKMMIGAKKLNLNLIVSSGFRDYATQKIILNNNLKIKNIETSTSIAKPGYSEHQLGIAIDLTSKSISYARASGKFEDIEEGKWLENNSYLYGFTQSYPKGKEDITGYIYEPWHYRYVGVENSKEIRETGKTINQFLKDKIDEEKIIQNKNQ